MSHPNDDEGANRGDTLLEHVTKAVGEWVAERGGMATGFTYAVEYIDETGGKSWAIGCMEGMVPWLTMGLLEFQQIDVRRQVEAYLNRNDEAG